MTKFRFVMAAIASLLAISTAQADIIAYNLAGTPGNQVSSSPSVVDPNVVGGLLVRSSGLTASAAANSFSASAWDVGDYMAFSFTINPGFVANLTDLQIGTRSSGTGPGTLSLFYSVDGFTNALAVFNQAPGGNFVNSIVDLSALTNLTGNIEFRLVMTNTTAANGGTVGSGGTFRITNYFDVNGDTGGFRLTGNVVSAIPEPSLFVLTGAIGLAGLATRRRK